MRDAASGTEVPEEASLAPSQDGEASPQARDERATVVGREEHTEEPSYDDVTDWVKCYESNPLVRVPVQNFASDVTEPGIAVTVDAGDDSMPTAPEDYSDDTYAGMDLDDALEAWLEDCYIDGWDFDADVVDLLDAVVKDRRGRRGTAIVEHAYDDPEKRQRVLGLRPINAETVTAYTRSGKGIVLRPDDDVNEFESVAVQNLSDSRDEAPETPAGKSAAIAQYDDIFGTSERDEIPFALDDITVSAYDPDTGSLFGQPDTATVVDRAEAVRKKLERVDQAVLNAAFSNIIAQVDSDEEKIVKKVRDNLDPNDPEIVSATNAPVNLTEVNGQVPDAVDTIQQEIEFVLAAMPTPLYRVGFAGDINRDITSEQQDDYTDALRRERRRLEADFQKILRLKATEFLESDAHADSSIDVDVGMEIRPDDATSPLQDDEFDADEFSTLMDGLSTAAGPKGGADTIVPKRVILETFLDMDPDEILDEESDASLAALDESDPRVREAFKRSIEKANLTFDQPRDNKGRFAETQGSFEHTPTSSVGPNTRIRLGIDSEKGDLKRFLAQLEHDFGEGYETIARSDHNPPVSDGHDVTEEGTHIDFVREGEKVDTEIISDPVSAGKGLRKAQDYLNNHAQELISEAEEWKDTANLSPKSVKKKRKNEWKGVGENSRTNSKSAASSSKKPTSATLAEGVENNQYASGKASSSR